MNKQVVWIYDCNYGQGSVVASSKEEALREAKADAGRHGGVRNVRRPTPDEALFRKAMGGAV